MKYEQNVPKFTSFGVTYQNLKNNPEYLNGIFEWLECRLYLSVGLDSIPG